jgi:hypothetical protein
LIEAEESDNTDDELRLLIEPEIDKKVTTVQKIYQ